MIVAIKKKNVDMVSLLVISMNGNLNLTDDYGFSPLAYACMMNDFLIVQVFISIELDPPCFKI